MALPIEEVPPLAPPSEALEPVIAGDDGEVHLRYAEGDDDVIAIHRFLCVVAMPTLPLPANQQKAIREIWRVVNHDVALMAFVDDELVGSIGLVKPDFWYSDLAPLVDRWFYILPEFRNAGIGKELKDEAATIAQLSGTVFLEQGRMRRYQVELEKAGYPSLANSPNNSTALAT